MQTRNELYQDAFSRMHPAINFIYFVVVIACSMFFLHPVFLLISLLCAATYSRIVNGNRSLKFTMIYVVPIMIISVILNPIFNHEGVTILAYFNDGNPLTLESILYGIAAAFMFTSVILWFSCYNTVMTSDKFIYIFGKIIPVMSLFFSMVLRFVPRYRKQIHKISQGQRAMGREPDGKNPFKKIRYAFTILSIMVTWALENAIETADSMKARGYGLSGRSSFSIFRMDSRDIKVLIFMLFSFMVIVLGIINGKNSVRYYPSVKATRIDWLSYVVYLAYLGFCTIPVILDWMEERAWKYSQSKT